ncbi:MAG TPA: TadE/TadG family type IV pilus assembly protein [Actinomycetota bacterium]|nr:TadE/TadG family type IV pilus assembly protein [Actinomycetota bacterium]
MSSLRGQRGAAAVEFAIIGSLLFILIFGIIEFGVAFMQLQTVRGAVREGARASAVGATIPQTQQKVADASTGIISPEQVAVVPCPGRDTSADTTVTLDTDQLYGGNGIVVSIPLIPDIHMSPEVSARFRCEL